MFFLYIFLINSLIYFWHVTLHIWTWCTGGRAQIYWMKVFPIKKCYNSDFIYFWHITLHIWTWCMGGWAQIYWMKVLPSSPAAPLSPQRAGRERGRAYNGAFNGTHNSASDHHPPNIVSDFHLKWGSQQVPDPKMISGHIFVVDFLIGCVSMRYQRRRTTLKQGLRQSLTILREMWS